MSKVTIFGHILRLKGHTRTLALAQKHNCRQIANEIGGYRRIDGRRTPLNIDLVTLDGDSYEEIAIKTLRKRGLELDHYNYRKKNRGYAVEFIFCVTSGHQCDFNAMYADSLNWFRTTNPELSIIHAVIHHDEDTPHMHVIVVPMLNGRLNAAKVCGYVKESGKRNLALFNYLDAKYGLTFPVFLKGAAKKAGSMLAIMKCKSIPKEELGALLEQPLIKSIQSRPEPFLHALGVTYEDVLDMIKTTST